MLDRFFVNPLLPARDGDRARAFYRDVLGLTLESGPADDPMFFRAGQGSALVVTEIPDRVPPDYPMVSFLVEGLDEVVATLQQRGATFRTPAGGSFAGREGTPDGVIMDWGPVRSAFVVDPEGNVLALNELARPTG